MICSNCGKELPNTAKFCSGCGAMVSDLSVESSGKGGVEHATKTEQHGTTQANSEKSEMAKRVAAVILAIIIIIMPFRSWVTINFSGGGNFSILNAGDFVEENGLAIRHILWDIYDDDANKHYQATANMFKIAAVVFMIAEAAYCVMCLGKSKRQKTMGSIAAILSFAVSMLYIIQLFRFNIYMATEFDDYPFNEAFQFTVVPFVVVIAALVQVVLLNPLLLKKK